MIGQDEVHLSVAAFIGIVSLLVLFAGLIVTGMKMYATVAQEVATLKAKVERLERVHNGGHDVPKERR